MICSCCCSAYLPDVIYSIMVSSYRATKSPPGQDQNPPVGVLHACSMPSRTLTALQPAAGGRGRLRSTPRSIDSKQVAMPSNRWRPAGWLTLAAACALAAPTAALSVTQYRSRLTGQVSAIVEHFFDVNICHVSAIVERSYVAFEGFMFANVAHGGQTAAGQPDHAGAGRRSGCRIGPDPPRSESTDASSERATGSCDPVR